MHVPKEEVDMLPLGVALLPRLEKAVYRWLMPFLTLGAGPAAIGTALPRSTQWGTECIRTTNAPWVQLLLSSLLQLLPLLGWRHLAMTPMRMGKACHSLEVSSSVNLWKKLSQEPKPKLSLIMMMLVLSRIQLILLFVLTASFSQTPASPKHRMTDVFMDVMAFVLHNVTKAE
jgi:hypothetical protein